VLAHPRPLAVGVLLLHGVLSRAARKRALTTLEEYARTEGYALVAHHVMDGTPERDAATRTALDQLARRDPVDAVDAVLVWGPRDVVDVQRMPTPTQASGAAELQTRSKLSRYVSARPPASDTFNRSTGEEAAPKP